MLIRAYEPRDEEAVVALWQACGLVRPWNDPRRDIARKLQVQPELFLVGVLNGGEEGERVVATLMAGYDGHRGWVNYLAVEPGRQGQGLGGRLLREAEARLGRLGCPKVNLQVRRGNEAALRFYEGLGYRLDDVVSMGKRLVDDAGPVDDPADDPAGAGPERS